VTESNAVRYAVRSPSVALQYNGQHEKHKKTPQIGTGSGWDHQD